MPRGNKLAANREQTKGSGMHSIVSMLGQTFLYMLLIIKYKEIQNERIKMKQHNLITTIKGTNQF